MRRGWEGGELLKRNVAVAAGTAQPVQANKNTTYVYTAGRCFILLDPHRLGWLPWRQGKTPLWGRWSLGTQREWSASHEHAWLLSTQHYPPPPQFCCPSAISPPHALPLPWYLQIPGTPMAPVPPHLLSAREVNAGNTPMKLESPSQFFPKEPVSKHEAPHSYIWDTNPANCPPLAQPSQLQEGTQLREQCQAGTEREPRFPSSFPVLAWFLAAFFHLNCWVQAWI